MILVGRYLSPFVRRVAASMKILRIPYERKALSVITDREAVFAVNPVGRVPALILDGGETLIESGAILDYLDERVGPARALVPAKGSDRRQVLRLVAVATGVADKSVSLVYESKRRPAEYVYPEQVEKLVKQVKSGLAELEKALGGGEWLVLGQMTQADISAAVAWDFTALMHPERFAAGDYPRVAALAQRLGKTPPFAETHPNLDN
ncbi:MAG: glutathione S-transferase family protein [Alphaproteobacteria bacterium]|nr:glutathione S-transferase family protein [Alphaproteobacteria bacterium]